MRSILFSFFCLGFFFSSLAINAESYNYSVDYSSCVRVSDAGYQSNGQRVIRFYNSCPSRLFINACVLDRKGNTKLYRSGSRVATNGTFTIYTFPDADARKVQMTAATSDPGIPILCKQEK